MGSPKIDPNMYTPYYRDSGKEKTKVSNFGNPSCDSQPARL